MDREEGFGVTTAIWGPLLWKMIHACLLAAKPRHALVVKRFFEALSRAMPCVYCRRSLCSFLEEMKRRSGGKDIANHVESNGASRWGFDLHNLVNDKLDAQAFREDAKKKGIGEIATDILIERGMFRGKRISFECMERRLRVQDCFGLLSGDVFQSMQLFVLQLGEDPKKVSSVRIEALQEYFGALAEFVGILCDSMPRLLESLRTLAKCASMKREWTEKDLYKLVWLSRRRHDVPDGYETPAERIAACDASFDRIKTARSHRCTKGTCF